MQDFAPGDMMAAAVAAPPRGLAEAALLADAMEQVGHGMLVLDRNQRIVAMNARFAAMAGLAGRAPAGSRFNGLSASVTAGLSLAGFVPPADPAAAPVTQHHRLPDGRIVAVRWAALADGGFVCTCEDVTEREHRERRIAHMALHDGLTDLPNRTAFHTALQRALLRQRQGDDLAVLCLDLDRFKQLNEAFGPRVADEVLRQAGQRLRLMVREEDMVARLGSDEFALIQSAARIGVQGAGAEAMARRAIEAFARPFEVDGARVVVGASAGIALAEDASSEDPAGWADLLLRRAQLALWRGKAEGRGQWHFFAEGMDDAAQARRAMENDLREALERQQFELHFQPLVSVSDRCVVAFEALLRWRHPTRGLVPPDAFIPLAEETGLIVAIGEWVLRRACAIAATWPDSAAGPMRVAVNLSSLQFGANDIEAQVRSALADSGLPGERLELEITESVLLADSTGTRDVLCRLRALGVRISLDDFGTGYSSLAYLNSFPVDKLKIDKRFVQSLGEPGAAGDGAGAIVRAIAGLGISLGIRTTAEGVETRAQLDQLVADGCTELQGYFFSPPRPEADVPALLDAVATRAA